MTLYYKLTSFIDSRVITASEGGVASELTRRAAKGDPAFT